MRNDDVRRFVVTIACLEIGTGSYQDGDVLAEPLLGGQVARLLHSGAVRQIDYDLFALFDGIEDAPYE